MLVLVLLVSQLRLQVLKSELNEGTSDHAVSLHHRKAVRILRHIYH